MSNMPRKHRNQPCIPSIKCSLANTASHTKRIPAGLSSARACVSAREPSRKRVRRSLPIFHPPAKKKKKKKIFLQRTGYFQEEGKPLQKWGQQQWVFHRAVVLGSCAWGFTCQQFQHLHPKPHLPSPFLSNLVLCAFPPCAAMHFPSPSWRELLPLRSFKQKASKIQFFFFLCPTLLETIQDLRFWGWILLSKVTAVRVKEQDPGKWAQNLATSFLCPGSARDANAAGRVALLKGKKWVCFMQQEHLRLVISKTNSTGDERTVPFTLLLQYTFAVIFPTPTSTRLHKKKNT